MDNRGIRQLPPPPSPAAPTEEKLDFMIQQYQRMIEILEGLTMPEIILPADFTLKFPSAIVTLSPDPEMLGNALQLRPEIGAFTLPTWRTALACPLGATTTLPFNIPPGWVSFRRYPMQISSDFYDPLIGINVYSDDILINPVAPMPLTGAFTIDMGEYVTQWTRLLLEVINATAINAVVSFQISTFLIDRSFWDSFVLPGIHTIRRKIEELLL